MASVFRSLVRKYGAVVFFPTFTICTIYADWSHTQKWKREVKEKLALESRELL